MKSSTGTYVTKNITLFAKRNSLKVISQNKRLKTSENFSYWDVFAEPDLTTKLGSLTSRTSVVPHQQKPNKNMEFISQRGNLDRAYKGVPAGPYTITGTSDDNDVILKGFAGQIIGANATTSGASGTFISTIMRSSQKTVVVKIEAELSILKK
jgi:hypothetical protein